MISTHKLVVLGIFLSIRIVPSSFHLLIFYFEKFSTWIWRLPFAVYVKLKVSFASASRVNSVKARQSEHARALSAWAKGSTFLANVDSAGRVILLAGIGYLHINGTCFTWKRNKRNKKNNETFLPRIVKKVWQLFKSHYFFTSSLGSLTALRGLTLLWSVTRLLSSYSMSLLTKAESTLGG